MSRYLRFGLVVFGIGLMLSVVSVPKANAQDVIQEILRRLDGNNKSLQSLKADVTMVKTNSQLGAGATDTTSGNTSYLPKSGSHPMYVRIDWTKPVEEQVAIIGDSYELYRPRLNQVITGKTANAKNSPSAGGALAFMSMSKEQLKANYTVIYIGEEQLNGGVKAWHLQLTPKAATTYKTAEIWVDGDGMPRQAKINERNDDTTTVLLSNIKKNEKVTASIFKLNYPSSVKKVKS